ncbi:hypothetical protein DFR37_103437 [Eoetvoesiella caeni]|uniref:Uncharacterized protein n=2 Tax=Eoetvoesiella caeni TaxID=645616 RepID=A0A366HF70_9BURK|nr:hypothetical protein DFR37_103437 [Eoetvoesiella caeni]
MRRQRGFAMLELTAALLITVLLAVWGASQLVNRINDGATQAAAVWMSSVRMAAHAYLDRNKTVLQEAVAKTELAQLGYADWSRPSLAELKNAGLLSAGFPEYGLRGMQAVLRVMRSGPCPGSNCRLEALVYGSIPLSVAVPSGPHEQMLAQWLLAAQGQGGAVTEVRPNVVGGSAFEFPNPPLADNETLPVGTVAMAVTAEQLAASDYLRVRDSRDPQFQNSLTVSGDIHAQASIAVHDHLSIGAQALERSFCAKEGLIARAQFGGLLVCQAQMWASAGGRGGGGYSTNSKTGCGAGAYNPITGSCSCPPGYGAVRIAESGSITAAEGLTRGYLCVS